MSSIPTGTGATGGDPVPETPKGAWKAPDTLLLSSIQSLTRASQWLTVARARLAWDPGNHPVWRGHRAKERLGMDWRPDQQTFSTHSLQSPGTNTTRSADCPTIFPGKSADWSALLLRRE